MSLQQKTKKKKKRMYMTTDMKVKKKGKVCGKLQKRNKRLRN